MKKDAKKVLIIEDELPIQRALDDILTDRGYTCFVADDGENGLELCFKHRPDLITLDLLMPKMDGMTLLQELRKDTWGAQAKVLILTNLSADDPDRMQALIETAPEYYLIKNDWTLSDIAKKVEEMLS